jgi:hypothetical protein
MDRKKVVIPHVPMRMEQVDGGRAVIGLIDCPWCGKTHYTTQIDCGERTVFCGTKNKKSERPDGRSRVVITQIF